MFNIRFQNVVDLLFIFFIYLFIFLFIYLSIFFLNWSFLMTD